ncbi:hypothetical protein M8C21_028240, partial [Ambrosia artemisiifolia]
VGIFILPPVHLHTSRLFLHPRTNNGDVEFKAVLFCHTMANAPPDLLQGLVDSNTLPFNVYGDTLQQHSSLKTIN